MRKIYKDEHEWTDEPTGSQLSVALANLPAEPAFAREILRLAQREDDLQFLMDERIDEKEVLAQQVQELEALAAAWKRTAETWRDADAKHLVRVADLEGERADLISERDAWKRTAEKRDAQIIGLEHQVSHEAGEAAIARNETRDVQRLLTERERQLAVAKAQIEQHREDYRADAATFNRTMKQLDAAESRGRQYCLELAEKAGRIQELEQEGENLERSLRDQRLANQRLFADAQLAKDLMAVLIRQCGDGERAVDALRRIILERDKFQEVLCRSAGEHARELADARLKADAFDALDREVEAARKHLRHLRRENERLCAEVERLARDGRDLEEAVRTHNVLADRVEQLAQALGKLDASTNPQGKPPAGVRLDSLEKSRGDHAVMLVDHTDRLKALESTASRLVDRVAALQAGKE